MRPNRPNNIPHTRKKQRKASPVNVTNKNQIRRVVERFLPDSEAQIRKLLMTGLNEIRQRSVIDEQQNSIDPKKFGGFVPAKVDTGGRHWVDKLIKDCLGAERDGILVVWKLEDGRHEFDPFTGEVKYDQ